MSQQLKSIREQGVVCQGKEFRVQGSENQLCIISQVFYLTVFSLSNYKDRRIPDFISVTM